MLLAYLIADVPGEARGRESEGGDAVSAMAFGAGPLLLLFLPFVFLFPRPPRRRSASCRCSCSSRFRGSSPPAPAERRAGRDPARRGGAHRRHLAARRHLIAAHGGTHIARSLSWGFWPPSGSSGTSWDVAPGAQELTPRDFRSIQPLEMRVCSPTTPLGCLPSKRWVTRERVENAQRVGASATSRTTSPFAVTVTARCWVT